MTDPIPSVYHEILKSKEGQLQGLIDSGAAKPVFLWHFLLIPILQLTALLIPRKRLRYARPAIFALILSLSVDAVTNRRLLLGGNGYVVGLVPMWWTIWSATILLFNDVDRDFQRIERRTAEHMQNGPQSNGTADNSTVPKKSASQREALVWQPYPESTLHRLNWAFGLILNMRLPEWNRRISSLGPLPQSVQAHLNGEDASRKLGSEASDARAVLKNTIVAFLLSYLYIDILKAYMIRDLYFMGLLHSSPSFPFNHLSAVPGAICLYRLLITGSGVYAALIYITSLNPLFFLGLSRAFPNAARKLSFIPLDAPWLYYPGFGPFITSILDNGLAGCWGQFWHQIFRFGFVSTGRWILSLLPNRLAQNRKVKQFIITFTAFSLSGLIHACGSYAQIANTRPLDTFMFFFLQAVGIVIEDIFKIIISTALPSNLPLWLRRTANAAFTLSWLFYTGSLIADDFARGGLWLTEPLPISFTRGLGFGAPEDEWWCWKGTWFRSWSDGPWWERGIQLA